MNNAIQVIGQDKYFVKARGQKITVEKNPPHFATKWTVYVNNAMARAWGNGHAAFRFFDSLESIEAKYKSLKGITAIHAAMRELDEQGNPLQ